MSGGDRVRELWGKFLHGKTVPGPRPLSISILAHCLVLALVVWLLVFRSLPIIIFPGRAQIAQRLTTAPVSLPPRSKGTRLNIRQKSVKKTVHKAIEPQQEFLSVGSADQELRARAQSETKGLIQNFKFRATYGFSTYPKYEFAFQIAGEMPRISPDQLPPHYEQYVVVEVTIGSDGQVAEARVISGAVDTKVQRTLLAAIHEFKYRPATREGIPVPSQCDIVIHVPS